MYITLVRLLLSVAFFVVWAGTLLPAASAPDPFARDIRPVLAEHCGACHNPANKNNKADFLKDQNLHDLESRRGLWHNVAAQLRNRTMPPVATKLTEQDRLRIATWIDQRLHDTACSGQDYAGSVTVRRLTRRDYHNTIRDMFGVDLAVSDLFPTDTSGGEGFDTNGETLFVPPMMMEKYLEAAQQVLDRAIVTPPYHKSFAGYQLQPPTAEKSQKRPIAPGQELTGSISVYADGDYTFLVSLERPTAGGVSVTLKVDGGKAGSLYFQRYASKGPANRATSIRLARGTHTVAVAAHEDPVEVYHFDISQKAQEADAGKKALHYRVFGMEPGETPLDPRAAAQKLLAGIVRQAYRRPIQSADLEPYLKLYDRAAERGDPFEEGVKLALKGVLVSPKFLFRVEQPNDKPGIHPLRDHEIASRLSYFLWSSMPDEELSRLADQGKLQDPKVLSAQVDRLLDNPRSRGFAAAFIGQWLGTQDVGGRVVPTVNDVQSFYTPEVAADLRAEPILLFHYMLAQNRSLLDFIDGNYTFLTERLVKFYQLEDRFPSIGSGFQKIEWPDDRRAGILGMGSVLAMTSHYKQTSPVLRGAWALETLLGTTVPPPPPDVPPLEASADKTLKLTVREKLVKHRANAACVTCHNLIDPMGFGLENFDWMGRWRDQENGKPVDASGVMPSGEKFNGPVELLQILLNRKAEFLRNLTQKMLGYALGRSVQDEDQCTVQRIVDALQKDHYGARTLIREIVLSIPFRNSQGGMKPAGGEPKPQTKKPRMQTDI
jgi:cytochrome c553